MAERKLGKLRKQVRDARHADTAKKEVLDRADVRRGERELDFAQEH